MELKDYKYNFIDTLYEYAGLWGRKSVCGLKVATSSNQTVVIVTDIYEGNPGGSITEYCAELAMMIAEEFSVDIDKMVFIHHNPEVNSRYDFYDEAFYKVIFENEKQNLSNPDWQKLSRADVAALVGE